MRNFREKKRTTMQTAGTFSLFVHRQHLTRTRQPKNHTGFESTCQRNNTTTSRLIAGYPRGSKVANTTKIHDRRKSSQYVTWIHLPTQRVSHRLSPENDATSVPRNLSKWELVRYHRQTHHRLPALLHPFFSTVPNKRRR